MRPGRSAAEAGAPAAILGDEMAKFIFISHAGERSEIDAETGTSAMYAAVTHGVEGILAECGGSLACATCHVYVDPSQFARLASPSAAEDEMLDATACERRSNSRLSCQIVMSDALDGLALHLPRCQQ